MRYTADKESISKHEVPKWFHDAKLGIFIHWGLFSVPAFAVTGIDVEESMKIKGLEEHFKNNPYAEWYLNTLKIPNSPTQKYHQETYGIDFSYEDFVPMFNEAIKNWKPQEWAELFKKVGAKYVVLTTKHCDGFLLWPSKQPNPKKESYHADRDIVGELTDAVKKTGMKMGFYYSTAWDWTFNLEPIKDAVSFLDNYINPPEYTEYVNKHMHELIDEYEPMILWGDMGYPHGTNVLEIFAYFYNKFPEGVVNDRWNQFNPKGRKFFKVPHNDFVTPEYKTFKRIKKKKFEMCRGIGNSFGYNKVETEDDYISIKELIHMFVDIVSKNGNLLLNVGPMADGTIPELQKKVLLGLGEWLNINGDAIFGTRPWKQAEATTNEGVSVRFTQKDDVLYVILLGKLETDIVSFENLDLNAVSKVELLGNDKEISWKKESSNFIITLPKNIEDTPAISLRIVYS